MRTIEILDRIVNDLDNRISALETDRSPDAMHSKLAFYISALQECADKLALQEARIRALEGNDSLVEDFTPQDLRKWFDASGLFVKDLHKFLMGEVGEDVTLGNTNDFLAAKFGDAKLRSKVGKWFRACAIKHNSERGI